MGGGSDGGAAGSGSGGSSGDTGNDQHNTPVGAIVGGIVVAVAVVIVAALAIFFYVRRRRAYDTRIDRIQTGAVSKEDILQDSGAVVEPFQYNAVTTSAAVANSSQFDVTERTPLSPHLLTPATHSTLAGTTPTAPSSSAGGSDTKYVNADYYVASSSSTCADKILLSQIYSA